MGKVSNFVLNSFIVFGFSVITASALLYIAGYCFPSATVKLPTSMEVSSVEGPKSLLITYPLDGKDFGKFDRLNITITNPDSNFGKHGLANEKVKRYEVYDARIWVPRNGKKHYPEELQPYYSNNPPLGTHAQVLIEEVIGKCYIDFYVKGDWLDVSDDLENLKYRYRINIEKVENKVQQQEKEI